MYIRYKGQKYYINTPVKEYKLNPVPIQVNEGVVKVTSWLGNKPFKVEVCEGAGIVSVPCMCVIPGYPISLPVEWNTLIAKIHKEKPTFTLAVSFSRDCLAHTDVGFKQELISKLIIEERHWGKVDVLNYKVVGIEMPDTLIINFSVGLRKHI